MTKHSSLKSALFFLNIRYKSLVFLRNQEIKRTFILEGFNAAKLSFSVNVQILKTSPLQMLRKLVLEKSIH